MEWKKFTHPRLSFTQDPRIRANFLKQTSTVLQSVTEFTRNPCKQGLLLINIYDLARAKSEALVDNTYEQKILNGDDNENGFKTNRSN